MAPPFNPPVPPVTGGMTPPAPGSPGSPFDANGNLKPTTPDSVVVQPPHWQRWWHYNRDGFLNLSSMLSGMDTRTTNPGEVTPAAKITPLLQGALLSGGDTQLIRGSLLALGRLPMDAEARQLLPLGFASREFLKGEHPPSREAAVLALGLGGDPTDLDALLALFQSTPEGVKLMGDERVDPRTRAFSAYALALFSERTEDAASRERIGRALLEVLVLDDRATFELHNAIVLALGLVPLPECDGTDSTSGPQLGEEGAHLCVGTQLGTLTNYFKDDAHFPALRAHAGPALARLAVNGLPEYKLEVGEALLEVLQIRSKAESEIQEGAIIGLGLLGDADSDKIDKDIRKALTRLAQKADGLTARLAMVSLARVSSRPGTNHPGYATEGTLNWLELKLKSGDEGSDAWAAMSLAVMAHDMAEAGQTVPDDIAKSLRSALKRAKTEELATSACVALGLLRDTDSAELVENRFLADDSQAVRGAAALALGLMENTNSIATLRNEFDSKEADPGVLRQVSIALRLLGDRTATEELITRLGESEDLDERSAIISTLGILHDPIAIPAIAAILVDSEDDDKLRGVAAFALAELADDSSSVWSESLSTDLTYSTMSWTLESPFGDGSGILDMRWW